MGGKQFISELFEGMHVDAPFVVRSRELRAARTGEAYLVLELADRTGRLSALLFRPSREAAAIPAGTVVRARGTVTSFRGARRLSLDDLKPATAWDGRDMLPSSARQRSELVSALREHVRSLGSRPLRRVLTAVFGDKEFFARFCECPGSESYHHAYLGGLLEHTVAVAAHCRNLAVAYPAADGDLLIAAALLHDIGKVDELSFDTSIGYTDRGRLLGHVVLGAERVRAACDRAGLDEATRSRLEHAVLAHHGELEWGSPKRPSTLEALLLHHIDNLDAKAAGFSEAVGGAALVDEQWTDSFNLFRRPLYAPCPAEDDRRHAPAEDAQYHRVSA